MDADDVSVVWIAPDGASSAAAPNEDASRALAEWARAKNVALAPPRGARAEARVTVDFVLGDRVERELDKAREAIAALDADAAERALARAEATLRNHPELPQAAWLRAEVSRGWASRYTRVAPRDEARALAAAQEADALDGGRAPGIGEQATPKRSASAPFSIAVSGAEGKRIAVRLDGRALDPLPKDPAIYGASVAPAEHHLVVAVDGAPAFATWVAVVDGAPANLAIDVADHGVCSADSFRSVTRDGATVRSGGIACPAWVAVVPGSAPGIVSIARCEGERCGPLVEWRSGSDAVTPGPRDEKRAKGFPAWATWTLVGVGAAAATTVALIAAGAFEHRPTETRFTNGGVRNE